jgi:pyruvate/2-oxoacid:ferredoxin oxidoreductase beta subunit
MVAKIKKARHVKGMRFILLICSCPTESKVPDNISIELMRPAVLSNVFPLEGHLSLQGRFKHFTE